MFRAYGGRINFCDSTSETEPNHMKNKENKPKGKSAYVI